MLIDKLDSGGKSNVKTNYVLVASKILLGISVVSFVLMLGGCLSFCSSTKTTYDSQETYYQKSDGTVGYGAKSNTTMDAPTVFVVSAGVCFVSLIAGLLVGGAGDALEEEDRVAE
jgi:uncharacterized protein YceK